MKRLTDILPRLAARPARVRLLAAAAVLLGVGLTAAVLSTSAATPGPGQAAGAITSFLGTWKGAFPPDPKLPGTEIEVRLSEGEPEAIVTWYRHVKGADGRTVSDSIVVDHTPPVVGDLKWSINASGDVVVNLKSIDRMTTVAGMAYSVDSSTDWQTVVPSDTSADSPEETYEFTIPAPAAGAHQITVRATDAQGNAAFETVNVTIEKG